MVYFGAVPPPLLGSVYPSIRPQSHHYINPALDYYSPARPAGATGAPTANHAPSNDGGRSSYASLLNKHALQDTFRHLHPNKREYTRNHIAHGVTLSKSRIDGIFISRAYPPSPKPNPCVLFLLMRIGHSAS